MGECSEKQDTNPRGLCSRYKDGSLEQKNLVVKVISLLKEQVDARNTRY